MMSEHLASMSSGNEMGFLLLAYFRGIIQEKDEASVECFTGCYERYDLSLQ